MLNILHLTIIAKSSLIRLYLSSCISTLLFTSPLTFLNLLFPISNFQSFLFLYTDGRNIKTSETAIYIFIIITCNTILFLRVHTCISVYYIPRPLIFTLMMHKFFLVILFLAAILWKEIFLLENDFRMPSFIIFVKTMSFEVR